MPSGFNPHNVTQDWETVVLRGKGKHVDAKKKRDGTTETQTRFDSSKSAAARKLDEAGYYEGTHSQGSHPEGTCPARSGAAYHRSAV